MRPLRGGAGRGQRDTNRVEAFSDGVVAIAITLLVLEVRVPHPAAGQTLWGALRDLWPSYLGYVLSFVIIGIIWANHHDIFRHIGAVDRPFVLLNGLFLLTVAFIPFPTALLAEYLGHEGEQTAVVVYSGWMLATAVAFNLLWRYPSANDRLIAPEADRDEVALITRRFNYGPPGYLLAFLVAFAWPPASLALLALLAALYVLPTVLGRD
jgi:uncharacterized membrane protein